MKHQKRGMIALAWSSADKIITNGMALVISIILARLIEPSEYGVLATASIFTVLLLLFVEPGMTSALIQKKESDKLDFSTILVFNVVIGVLLYCLLFCSSNRISRWFDMPVLSEVIKALGLQVIIGGVNSVQVAYMQKNMMFKHSFMCSFVSVLISASVAIMMAYSGMGVWALVVYNLLKQIISTAISGCLLRGLFSVRFSLTRFQEMFPFAGKMLFTKFIDQGYVEATQTIIGKCYSSTELAFYNKGKSFPDLLMNSLNTALSNVMFPYFSGIQDHYDELKSSMRVSVQMTSYICIPMMIGLMACADNFIFVVLTEQWMSCVPFLQLSCFYYIWIPFSNVIRQALKGVGKGGTIVMLETVKLILNIVSLIILLLWLRSPIAIALSVAFSYTVSFFVEWYVVSKNLGYRIREIIKDFAPSLVVSCIMGGTVFILGQFDIHIGVKLVLQVFGGVICYLLMTCILKFSQVKRIVQLFCSMKNKL